MKTIRILYSLCIALTLASCQKDCEKPPVDPKPADPTTPVPAFSNWTKLYGGTDGDHGYASISTLDGGSITVGVSRSTNGDISEPIGMVALKVDHKGKRVWQKSLGGNDEEVPRDIIATPDGGYIVLGDQLNPAQEVKMVKINADGNVLWRKTAPLYTDKVGYVNAAVGVTDGYIMTGKMHKVNDIGAWVVKFDYDGEVKWETYIGAVGYSRYPKSIITSGNGECVIAGNSVDESVPNSVLTDAWVVKVSITGNVLWEKTLGGSRIDQFDDVAMSNDGAYILTGKSISNDGDVNGQLKGSSDVLVAKLDASGNIQFVKLFGGSAQDGGTSIIATTDGNYLVAGQSTSTDGDIIIQSNTSNFSPDIFILKLNQAGNKMDYKVIGGSDWDQSHDLIRLNGNGYLLTGFSSSNDRDVTGQQKGGGDILLSKFTF